MNLVGDPWIPVLFEDGSHKLVSLQDLFAKGETIRDLSVNPAQRIALMRLLICIAQAALDGPKNEEDWKTSLLLIAPQSLKYLEANRHSFDLFGDKPFLQVSDLMPTLNASMDKLEFGLAAGNNPKLFDHGACEDGRCHVSAHAALSLLTFQCFSPGGMIGITSWSGIQTSKNSEHAPCLESSPLHTILRGGNVVETIWLNLLSRKQVQEHLAVGMGRPVWEQTYATLSPVPEWTQTYLGRMIPLSRGILLDGSLRKCTFVNGFSFAKLPNYREAMLTVTVFEGKKGQEYRYLPLRLERHPWRELNSVLNLNRKGKSGGPLALEHLCSLERGTVDIWTGGLAADKGKLLDMAEWVFSVPAQLLDTGTLEIYGKGVEWARRGEFSLKESVKKFASEMKMADSSGLFQWAAAEFWSVLDAQYNQLIEIAQDHAHGLDPWVTTIRRAMYTAYNQACPSSTPRQMRAFVAGQSLLHVKEPSHD